MDNETRRRKAVILAAGKDALDAEGRSMMLSRLGDRSVLECVLQNALEVAPAKDIAIVVGYRREDICSHLGAGYRYVIQESQLGTGHAALQASRDLADFDGDLLILYGDTPLFRPGSIRGLLNRHELKKAHLTLLTAVMEQPLPYGRIIRNADGRIMDIIENSEASPEIRQIRECNVGAYVVNAKVIFTALERLSPSPEDGDYRLTDCVHQLIRAGLRVESYRIYDPDEVQGINGVEDLARAEFILQKRLFRPRRQEERNLVTFGTGGWRAIIGEGFTMHNVRRLSQALANEITRQGGEERGVVIGYDRRFLSRQAAEASAEVFGGNNIQTVLLNEDAPTPLITYATAARRAAYGLVFTASHNPPEWNGLKVFQSDGALLLDEETQRIEAETNTLTPEDVIKLELDIALDSGIVQRGDFTNEYVDAVEKLIDLQTIRNAALKVIVDPMYGVGQLTLGTVLTEARCRVTFIHERHNPLFGGRSPAPNAEALRLLTSTMRDDSYDLGLAMDGDADRIAIVDELGEYIPVNDVLLLLYWYLHEVRGERGGVVRNLATTHLLDRLAHRLGEECYEMPVGFKHIVSSMVEHDALLGGESSGGLTIRGHILGKDGIFAAALIVEMRARTGKKISQLRSTVYELTGRLYDREETFPATPEMRIAVPRKLQDASCTHIGPYPVLRISHLDGTKLYLENDNWALLRFSGTEPVLRLVVEADTPEKASELMAWLKQFVEAQ
ncbi:MAG: NTP transferase domain-containing protein [Candidatus Sulfopaludibacter sp.]|nr:NTP transferase domain-containing protein [Candidatus Sulfopaludibacter sp.]